MKQNPMLTDTEIRLVVDRGWLGVGETGEGGPGYRPPVVTHWSLGHNIQREDNS